jgi:fibronectin type 3 domain-containing protein
LSQRPTGLTASQGTSTTAVNLLWAATPNATSYKVYRAGYFLGTTSTASYADNTAPAGSNISYFIRAVSPAGDSESSSVVTGWRNLAAPTGLVASDGAITTGVNLNWTAVPGVLGYKIYRSTGNAVPTYSGSWNTNVCADNSAVPGTLYNYAITAVTAAGETALSAINTGWCKPLPPASVAATDGTSLTGVTISWPAATGAASYKVFRAIGTGTAAQIGTVTAPALTYTDTTAVGGTLYNYSVKTSGQTGTGDSDVSAVNAGWRQIAAPVGLASTSGSSTTGVNLSWTSATGAVSYKVFRGIGAASAQVGTSSTTTYADASAVPGTIYTYAIKAVSLGGDSAASATITSYRGLSAPLSVAATDGTSSANVTVTWAASTGATGYKILRAIGSAVASQIGTTTTALTFADTNAVPGTIYNYSVKASGATGVSDSVASTVDAGYRGLTAPASVAATDGTSSANVTVTWAASTGATGYKILRAIGSAVASQIGTTTTALTFADTTAVPGTIYNYSVKASGATGVSDSVASVVNAGYRGFTAPASVVATDGTSSVNATVTWVASTGATSYKVFRGATLVTTVSAPATSYADVGGVAGTVYAYTVKAAGLTGVSDSPASNADNGWRNLPAPTGLIASDNLTTKINVKWNAVAGATGYKVYRGTSAGSLPLLTTIAVGTTITFDDTTAAVGATYIYAVTARSAAGESAQSTADTGVKVAGFTTADTSKPTDPGDGSYSPNTTEAVTEEPEIAPMGVQRYLQVIAITLDATQACDVEADAQPTAGDTTEDETTDGESTDPTIAPATIDLDQNGEPDLCQLRRGDLDLNGRLDEADLALLLTMIGEEPMLGFGDLNGDGVIDGGDVQVLSQQMDALANAN